MSTGRTSAAGRARAQAADAVATAGVTAEATDATDSAGTKAVPIMGELTIQTAAATKDLLLQAADAVREAPAGDLLELDLSGVTELDTAGLQLLLLVRRELAHAGRDLVLVAPPAPVTDMLALAGLDEMLGAA